MNRAFLGGNLTRVAVAALTVQQAARGRPESSSEQAVPLWQKMPH